MTEDDTGNNAPPRSKNGTLDQRQGQMDPAGRHRESPSNASAHSTKQPGNIPSDQGEDSATGSKKAASKRADPGKRQNAQGDHAGAPHSPEEFDVMNPQKPDSTQENT